MTVSSLLDASALVLAQHLPAIRVSQAAWAQTPVVQRLAILRKARHCLAARSGEMAAGIGLTSLRNATESVAVEILPLLEAIRYLEKHTAGLLKPCRQSWFDVPLWMLGQRATTYRMPLGVIGIIAPANYPLFLAGVQACQALAAGNAVILKPAPGSEACLSLLRDILHDCGLPHDLLRVTSADLETAEALIGLPLDLVILTGSAITGRRVMSQLAEHLTPSIMELSGCDACIVLPDARPQRVLNALAFGLRLNGSHTCIAPRRLFLIGSAQALLPAIIERLLKLAPMAVTAATAAQITVLSAEARRAGADIKGGEMHGERMQPLLVLNAKPAMAITQADLFAPVLSIVCADDAQAVLTQINAAPYALGASVFGPPAAAAALARQLSVGAVTVNDLIAPTAEPSLSFGGIKTSGFGVTRGKQGLLALTRPMHVIATQNPARFHYRALTPAQLPLFTALTLILHGKNAGDKLHGVGDLVRAMKKKVPDA